MKKLLLIASLAVAAAVLILNIALSAGRLDQPSKVAKKYYEALVDGNYNKAAKYVNSKDQKEFQEYFSYFGAVADAFGADSSRKAQNNVEILVSPAVYNEDNPEEATVYVTAVKTESGSTSTSTVWMINEKGSWVVADPSF